jgi:hypothetical protein
MASHFNEKREDCWLVTIELCPIHIGVEHDGLGDWRTCRNPLQAGNTQLNSLKGSVLLDHVYCLTDYTLKSSVSSVIFTAIATAQMCLFFTVCWKYCCFCVSHVLTLDSAAPRSRC